VKWSFRSSRGGGGIAAPSGGEGPGTGVEEIQEALGEGLAGSLGELTIPEGNPDVKSVVPSPLPEEAGNESEQEGEPAAVVEGKVSADPQKAPLNPIQKSEWEAANQWIEDESGEALNHFHGRLARLAQGEGVQVRIAHYGDSTIAADDVTRTLRRNFQLRFGDAGHGYLVPARGKLPYGHKDIKRKEEGDWDITTITSGGLKRGEYGYGGMVARGYPGTRFKVGTVKEGPIGTHTSKLLLYTEGSKGRGEFTVQVDGGEKSTFSTQGESGVLMQEVSVPDGPHQFRVSVRKGRVSFYGIALERDAPGVIYDSLGLVGAIGKRLLKWGDEHIKRAFELRTPDLLVLHFGGNESAYSNMTATRYEKDLRAMVDRMKASSPQSSCLLFSPLDQGERVRGRVRTVPILLDIVDIQRRVAKEKGCGFWSTFDAMGGEGSMGRWRKSKLASGDLRHATRAGYQVIGNLAYQAFLKSFSDYWARTYGDGSPVPLP